MSNHIVQIARSYIGTPYRHQGRLPGVALDCIGVPICVAWEIGFKPRGFNVTGYRRIPDGVSLLHHLTQHMVEIDQADLQPADLVVVSEDVFPHHVGIVGDYPGGLSFIHAAGRVGKVVEQRLCFTDDLRFAAAFRFGGH